MDPFEIRLQFTRMLQKLNASVNASRNCAAFALKHKELDEDLHSCILEQLESSSMNNRVNLLYFIEHLLDTSVAKNSTNYVTMIVTDMPTIVDSVAPPDPSGLQNIGSVRKVLTKIRDKNYITLNVYQDLLDKLQERETTLTAAGASADITMEDADKAAHFDEAIISGRSRSPFTPTGSSQNTAQTTSTNATSAPHLVSLAAVPPPVTTQPIAIPPISLQQHVLQTYQVGEEARKAETKAIEQRMEEDRERHKRLRENIWAVFPPKSNLEGMDVHAGVSADMPYGVEFEMFWGDESEGRINEDDEEDIAEEADIKEQSRR